MDGKSACLRNCGRPKKSVAFGLRYSIVIGGENFSEGRRISEVEAQKKAHAIQQWWAERRVFLKEPLQKTPMFPAKSLHVPGIRSPTLPLQSLHLPGVPIDPCKKLLNLKPYMVVSILFSIIPI